ncbi:DUF4395 domain-containing protein [Microbacterium betulae]|uniref:DUF4395 domain-containing protein n=1 Tax=Microbacterium betulae TaxID=2981139 RepID=A0AA97FEC8_9MICO|nr:DUF4395 domain-containing protein [Microbacterium sp. AB]WOF22031.1 DUF4395 domain-containing protein [Microbacterium sp. AB]
MPESPSPAGIDPRSPRFAASITSVLLLVATFLSFVGVSPAAGQASLAQRAADPGFVAVLVVALLFLWGVVSPGTAPWGVLFRRSVRPRLQPPAELEDPRPPRFAQGVGLLVTGVGLLLHLAGVPWALPVAAAAAFVAAFLNGAFGYCLGCQIYLLLQRAGIVGRQRAA